MNTTQSDLKSKIPALLTLVLILALASPAYAHEGRRGGGPGRHGGGMHHDRGNNPPGPRGGPGASRDRHPGRMKRFDKNGDGRLGPKARHEAREAWREKREERFKQIDQNGDGKIDKAERQQVREKRDERREAWRKTADTNSDGKIDPQERQAIRDKWRAEHLPGTAPQSGGPVVTPVTEPAAVNTGATDTANDQQS